MDTGFQPFVTVPSLVRCSSVRTAFASVLDFFLDCCQLLDLVCGESQPILQCSNARRAVRIKLSLAHMHIPPHHRMVLHVLHL